MKVKTLKNIDDEIFKAKASFFQKVKLFFFSDILMNVVTVFFIIITFIFLISVAVREFKIHVAVVMRIAIITVVIFLFLIIFRSRFWILFKK